MKTRAPVHLKKNETVTIDAGRGCMLQLTRYADGAVELRNLLSGSLLRQWSPKEAKSP